MWQTSPIANIYNPLNQTEKELMKNFVVRKREFNAIYNDIKSSDIAHPEPHFIIQGQSILSFSWQRSNIMRH